ncbi:MAG TPA: hypothetical protein DEP42_03260 [Ruminococcaceae bacterium]|nr:hypothetical protein [Oscillospiraceae bacterium]
MAEVLSAEVEAIGGSDDKALTCIVVGDSKKMLDKVAAAAVIIFDLVIDFWGLIGTPLDDLTLLP